MGKAEENKLHKRNALLSHAFCLFMDNGVSNTSISDITEKAGVAKGTFYSYFKDKDDLIQKLIAQRAESIFEKSIEALHSQPEMSVDDSIIFLVNDIIDQLISDNRLHRFIHKNLMFGIMKKNLTSADSKENDYIINSYLELITKNGDEWDEPLLMLYTIIEFVASTCYSIVIDGEPVSFEHYKPYMCKCIKGIIAVYRK